MTNQIKPPPSIEAATYNVPDIASMLKCSERHVRNMAESGDIPGMIRFGRLVRFHRQMVDEWLDSQAQAVKQGDHAPH